MNCVISPLKCGAGAILPLLPEAGEATNRHLLQSGQIPDRIGAELLCGGEPLFQVCGFAWLPMRGKAFFAPLLRALKPVAAPAPAEFDRRKTGWSVAVITLSDKGSAGLREDTAGPLASRMLAGALPVCFSQNFLLPDDKNLLRGLLAELALTQKYDLVCACGGTGASPRDITPQTTESLLDFSLPGFGEAMRAASLAKTPNAIISRAVCGVIGECLALNLPGSAKAARENLEAVLPALGHALAKLHGDPADCGG